MPDYQRHSKQPEIPRAVEVFDLTRDQQREIARTRLFRAASVFAAGVICVAAGAAASVILKKRT